MPPPSPGVNADNKPPYPLEKTYAIVRCMYVANKAALILKNNQRLHAINGACHAIDFFFNIFV